MTPFQSLLLRRFPLLVSQCDVSFGAKQRHDDVNMAAVGGDMQGRISSTVPGIDRSVTETEPRRFGYLKLKVKVNAIRKSPIIILYQFV